MRVLSIIGSKGCRQRDALPARRTPEGEKGVVSGEGYAGGREILNSIEGYEGAEGRLMGEREPSPETDYSGYQRGGL
jgi:hypothetical protein